MTLRKFFFWLHLTAGSVAGVIILIMSVTGVLLMYERQIVEWADRGFRVTATAGAQRLPVEAILARVETRSALPSTVTLRSDAGAPATLAFGRDGAVYANPYTGEMLGEGSRGARDFFRAVTDWHRWLGKSGESRAAARAVTGACNLGFLFLVTSGLYLWWPRKWAWPLVRSVMFFRGGLRGKARDFNWHNAIGFWCCIPLFFVVITGVVMSYPWANNLLYTLTRSEPPSPGGGRGPGGSGGAPPADLDLSGVDELWAQAERQAPGWRSISLRIPNSARAPLTFSIDEGDGGQPQKRSTLTLNRKGEVVRWETFDSLSPGRRLRSWGRFVHTGEAFGVGGQTIAGVASAGGVMLVWTGLMLALRRLRGWRARRNVTKPELQTVGSR